MNAAWLVIITMFVLWGIGALSVFTIDAVERRRHRLNLELRDWREKVEAMKRMHDREGDA
jgi:hypothetical protein